jgi:hypothetical protein
MVENGNSILLINISELFGIVWIGKIDISPEDIK